MNQTARRQRERLVAAEQRGAGVEAAPVAAERPADDDALVAGRRRLQDTCGEAAEHADPTRAVGVDRVGAGAVQRRPDERPGHLRRAPRRDDPPVAGRRRSQPERVALLASRPADEAARERMVRVVGTARGNRSRLVERDRLGRLELELRCPRLGDERVAVEHENRVVGAVDAQGRIQRGRQPQGHLDCIGVQEPGHEPARIAAVPRARRAAKTALDDDRLGHDGREELPGLDSNQQPSG